jgi:hypothetical protein
MDKMKHFKNTQQIRIYILKENTKEHKKEKQIRKCKLTKMKIIF